MKLTIRFITLSLCLLGLIFTACQNVEEPNTSYRDTLAPVEKTNELSTIMRIPLEATMPGLDYKETDPEGMRIAENNGTILQPVIRQLVTKVEAGEVPLYSPDDFTTPIDFSETYKGIKDNGGEAAPLGLSHTVEIKCELSETGRQVKSEVSGIRLVWRDHTGQYPEKNIGFVKTEDLQQLNLKVEVNGQSQNLLAFLNSNEFEYFPIQTAAGTDMAMGVRTLEEAYVIKGDLKAGNFEREPYY